MREFKSTKNDMLKFLFEKNGFVTKLKDDGSKYGGQSPYDLVSNDILGITTVKKVKELESKRAIVFQGGKWKIKTQLIMIGGENKDRFHAGRHLGEVLTIPYDAWYEYEESKKNKSIKEMEDHRESFNQLVFNN